MEPQLSYSLILFIIALSIRGLFSFLETTITALRLFKIKELESKTGTKYAYFFTTLEKHPQQVLITILVANSFADVTTAALAAHIMENIFANLNLSGDLGFSVGIIVATIAIIVFGEIIPKNIAKHKGEYLFTSMLWLINGVYTILYPVAYVLFRFSETIMAVIGGKSNRNNDWVTSESEIRFLINYIRKMGLMEPEKSQMLQSIFELASTPVKESMIPATDIVSVANNLTIQDALNVFLKRNFTRLPVYKENHENIIGIVHLKDVISFLSKNQNIPLQEIIRPVLFVPEGMKINQLLKEFTANHKHMAMVLNEHGNLIGLITLEDILEEIVGEINDEHELANQKIQHLENDTYLAQANTPLDDLKRVLLINFDTTGVLTLGEFIAEQLQHLPKQGETIIYKNYSFEVQKATPKRVLQLLIFKNNNQK